MPKTKRQSSSSKNARTVPMLRARAVRDWLSEYHGARQAPLALMAIGIKDLSQINQRFGRAERRCADPQGRERNPAVCSQ